MSKPSHFITNSDFATFKNDGTSPALTITVPSGQTVSGSGTYTDQQDITIGKTSAIIRGNVASSKASNDQYACQYLSVSRSGTVSGSPASYSINAFFWHPDATTIRCQVLIQNPYGSTLTGASGAETFTFKLNTIVPPYA